MTWRNNPRGITIQRKTTLDRYSPTFLEDGRVELDTNTIERAIKPQILTRKNALFAGSDGGAEHWACIASLLQTCKLNDVEPQAWLTDTLARIAAGHKIGAIAELLPWAWKARQRAD